MSRPQPSAAFLHLPTSLGKLQQFLIPPAKVRGHPNIVNMLGSCNTTVVTEAYPMNLEEYVSASPEALPIRSVVSISLDAARSVQALHEAVEAPIVHFDIKPSQLLMAEDGRVKLNDFNLAWIMSTGSDGSPCLFTTKPWVTEGPWRPPEFRSAQVPNNRSGALSVITPASFIRMLPCGSFCLPKFSLFRDGIKFEAKFRGRSRTDHFLRYSYSSER